MAERIQRSSTVNWADVVCAACPADRNDRQFQERRDRPPGEYRFVFMSLCAARRVLVQKDVKEGLIKGARVRFRPGKEIKDALKTLDFSKYKPENMKETRPIRKNPKPKPDPDDGDGSGPNRIRHKTGDFTKSDES